MLWSIWVHSEHRLWPTVLTVRYSILSCAMNFKNKNWQLHSHCDWVDVDWPHWQKVRTRQPSHCQLVYKWALSDRWLQQSFSRPNILKMMERISPTAYFHRDENALLLFLSKHVRLFVWCFDGPTSGAVGVVTFWFGSFFHLDLIFVLLHWGGRKVLAWCWCSFLTIECLHDNSECWRVCFVLDVEFLHLEKKKKICQTWLTLVQLCIRCHNMWNFFTPSVIFATLFKNQCYW